MSSRLREVSGKEEVLWTGEAETRAILSTRTNLFPATTYLRFPQMSKHIQRKKEKRVNKRGRRRVGWKRNMRKGEGRGKGRGGEGRRERRRVGEKGMILIEEKKIWY